MSIRFYCSCGKHLKAREAMAGRRSQCPACGQPVGIPALAPTQRGTAPVPVSVGERQRATTGGIVAFPVPALSAAEAEATLEALQPGRAKRRPRPRRIQVLEKNWYECLTFPARAAPLVLPLTIGLTALTLLAVTAWPQLDDLTDVPWWIWAICWVVPFLGAGYVAAFLQCVLASGAAGEVGFVRWPGSDLALIARSLVCWMACFLAGPIVFAALAGWFWLHAGDPQPIDWLILLELGAAGTAHFFLALVALHQTDRLGDVNPLRVADLIRRFGYGLVAVTLALATVALVLVLAIVTAIGDVHGEPAIGGFLVGASWLGLLAWLTFVFRLLGWWCFQSRVEAA